MMPIEFLILSNEFSKEEHLRAWELIDNKVKSNVNNKSVTYKLGEMIGTKLILELIYDKGQRLHQCYVGIDQSFINDVKRPGKRNDIIDNLLN